MKKITVIAKCVNCGATKEISANEIKIGEVPMCDKCYMPMVAEKAKIKK